MERHADTARTKAQTMLDELWDKSVVLDKYGDAWQLGSIYWYRSYGDDSMVSSHELSYLYPFKVIHSEPKRAGLPVIGGPM